ncbi:hypothetical protein BOTBODRAFT_500583 [Botryobasidium botryosum FD-172 SS1]|uniref:Uncharacterized protein n=1 Tax=Botryobasidium botryosum (strain FD-172 SS1) TaxID=930990 RepID=A0A067M3A8_BOTB1|nr:hypothetical protein BOTBODRAFT_500583 [Botryobasidium botryosum FD-172 SS1]
MWATIVHGSMQDGQRGVTLRDLSELASRPLSLGSGCMLLYHRLTVHSGAGRDKRREYDTRRWSIYLIGFIATCVLTSILPFFLARIIGIDIRDVRQGKNWSQISVIGDLSATDIANAEAEKPFIEDWIRTWTLHSVSSSLNLPHAISFPWGSDKVFFSEAYKSQLVKNGSGFGTFVDIDEIKNKTGSSSVESASDDEMGSVLRWPRWGVRVRCASLPNPQTNIVMASPSGSDYAYIPRTVISSLFTSLSMPVPPELTVPFSNASLEAGDSPPAGMNTSQIAYVAPFPIDGVGFSFKSEPLLEIGEDGSGWVQLEVIMVRLNTSLTPQGVYSAYFTNSTVRLGYDVAVCVEIVEPYVLDVYNGTYGVPNSLSILEKSNTVLGKALTGVKGKEKPAPNLVFALNSTGKGDAWVVAHDNSRNVMLKDNGRDKPYVPSPTAVSFTNGTGPEGYTKLDPARVANVLAESDASNLLPYLVGTEPILAHQYLDRTVAYTQIDPWILLAFIGIVLVFGVLGTMFVPTLPLGLPRRNFGTASFVMLRGEGLPPRKVDASWEGEELEDLEQRLGNSRLRFGV